MLRSLIGSSHPGPSVAVTLISFALAVGVGLEPWQIAAVTVMILFNQFSVGLSNDWLDATRDRRSGRTDKPIAVGEISSRAVAVAALAFALAAVLLSLTLGPLAAIAHAVFLASGWVYNLGVKSTPASVIPYIVGFGSLPAIVTLAASPPQLAHSWALAAGALLGVAAHFSNVLPDLGDDRATGVRGLPHIIGARSSGIVIAVSLVAASLAVVFGPPGTIGAIPIIGFALTLTVAVTSVVLVVKNTMKRMLFQLTIAAAMINVALLLLSSPQLS
ncbi:1,4-dihydroxy-2-naphthoate octaprenyltransferase [marine actinobacterium PHSC20C1]|nr:1,4-dihydroxy-2-naphthoate octaprenyltransferase [marine actinobacterium PHSC20C1]